MTSLVIRVSRDGSRILSAICYGNNKKYPVNPRVVEALIDKYTSVEFSHSKNSRYELIITDKRIINALNIPHVNKAKSRKLAPFLAVGGAIVITGLLNQETDVKVSANNSEQEYDNSNYYAIVDQDIKAPIEDEIEYVSEIKKTSTYLDISEPTDEEIEQIQSKYKDDQVVEIDYKDRTTSEDFSYSQSKYQQYAEKYGKIYGIDPNIILALITQENPYERQAYAKGIMGIEPIWFNEPVTAYNYDLDELETITIDEKRLDDYDYCVKVGSMIFGSYFRYIYKNFPDMSPSEQLKATIAGYNKGIYGVAKLIRNYGNDYLSHLNELSGGDNEYLNRVGSYIDDGKEVYLYKADGSLETIVIDNTNSNSFSR